VAPGFAIPLLEKPMLRRVLIALLLSPLLACAQSQAPADTASTPETPAASATATPAVAETPAPSPVETAATPSPADVTAADVTQADVAAAPTVATADTKPAAPIAKYTGPEPRLGTDYEILETPQPTWTQGPGIEIAEVFGYTCIHCHDFQPEVDKWMAHKPADMRWVYVPAVFGEPWDTFARAFFAAEMMGVRERTHDAVFKAVHDEHAIKTGSPEEIGEVYGKLGVDPKRFVATMGSFGVTAKLEKARQFATRAGVRGTPTLIVAGKYRVLATRDRGWDGMLKTAEYLASLERAGKTAGAP
jgi:thiol:disulfide interchange protein DsbA